jgi:hypothetical protein
MLGTVRCIRQGVAVFEVKDVHADFTRLVFDWCDDLAAHELGAYTKITRRKKDKQEGEQSYWISCYTYRLLIKHKVSMYPFKFDIHIITVYPKYTTIDQSGLDSNRSDEKTHFGVVKRKNGYDDGKEFFFGDLNCDVGLTCVSLPTRDKYHKPFNRFLLPRKP